MNFALKWINAPYRDHGFGLKNIARDSIPTFVQNGLYPGRAVEAFDFKGGLERKN